MIKLAPQTTCKTMEDKNHEVYTKAVRAGKRTYFFDIKTTKGNEFYITLTESKKLNDQDGREVFQKHKIFLYKEDFEKFREGLDDVLTKIYALTESDSTENAQSLDRFTISDFED